MADTDIDLTQFRTELGAVKTAIRAADWATARQELAAAAVTLAGLEASIADAQASASYRANWQQVSDALDKAEDAAAARSGKARLGVVSTSHGRR